MWHKERVVTKVRNDVRMSVLTILFHMLEDDLQNAIRQEK